MAQRQTVVLDIVTDEQETPDNWVWTDLVDQPHVALLAYSPVVAVEQPDENTYPAVEDLPPALPASIVNQSEDPRQYVVVFGARYDAATDNTDVDLAGYDVVGPVDREQADSLAEQVRARFADLARHGYLPTYGEPFVEVQEARAPLGIEGLVDNWLAAPDEA